MFVEAVGDQSFVPSECTRKTRSSENPSEIVAKAINPNWDKGAGARDPPPSNPRLVRLPSSVFYGRCNYYDGALPSRSVPTLDRNSCTRPIALTAPAVGPAFFPPACNKKS